MEAKWYTELPPDWNDTIASFENSTVFHSSEWLNHVADQSSSFSIKAVALFENETMVALIPYVEVKKAFVIKIFASPLGGTGTNFMGPLFNLERSKLGYMLDFLLTEIRLKGYHHVEMNSRHISKEVFVSTGFRSHTSITNIIELPETEEEAWSQLKSSCRNRIKKAQKQGCTMKSMKDDLLPLQFQKRLEAVYSKQKLKAPFGVERSRSLCRNVKNILPLRIVNDGNVVAAGIFPYDDDSIYFWGGAALPEDYKYYPNEIMHWEVIKFAVANNIKNYNMCGGTSQFKNKFGGKDQEFVTYSLSFLPFLDKARALYKRLHFLKIRIKGFFSK